MFRRIAAGGVALLVLFHAWLFAGQVLDGRLADPAVLARWGAAALLLAALEALRRTGGSLFRGRRAVGIWLLAALLHAPAAGDRLASELPAIPETAATILQIGAVAAGLLLTLWLAPVSRRRRHVCYEILVPGVAIGPSAAHLYWAFAPRPPPSA